MKNSPSLPQQKIIYDCQKEKKIVWQYSIDQVYLCATILDINGVMTSIFNS